MKQLRTISDQDFDPAASVEPAGLELREAARAIVFDGEKVALLKVNKHNYYKLPGGGIEEGEDRAIALVREVLEEIGCNIEVTAEVGQIAEYREKHQLKQISYCYVANKIGKEQSTAFTAKELADGFEVYWAASLDEAIRLVSEAGPDNYAGRFIQKRDLEILRAAAALV